MLRRMFYLSTILVLVATLGNAFSPALTATAQTPQYRIITFHVVPLNSQLKGAVSFIQSSLPNPSVADEPHVLRLGGQVDDLSSGTPMAYFTVGQKAPENLPLMLGFGPGNQSKSLQFGTCDSGQNVNPDPYNDMVQYLLVADWAVQPNAQIQTWVDDQNNQGAGVSQTLVYTDLVNAPTVQMIAVLLDSSADNKISRLESWLGDVWQGDTLGNKGGFYVDWKDSSARGIAIHNKTDDHRSLEVPVCTQQGGEYLNDGSKPYLLLTRDQVLNDGGNMRWIDFEENDNPSSPGQTWTVDYSTFGKIFLPFTTFLPVVTR